MKSRAKTIVWGILTLATFTACSGGDDNGPPRTAEGSNGGLDGGGSIGVGLSWEKGIFVQAIWVDGQPRLLVSNRRADEVSFGVFAAEWGGEQHGSETAPSRGALLAEAVVPAHATRTVDAAALVGPMGELLWIDVDDAQLGLLYRLQPPSVAGTLPVISTDASGRAQIETDFSVLPDASFEATVTLNRPGQLWLQPSASPTADVQFLTATDASSEDAVVTTTTDGFRVELPAETSETNPARVQLSFSLPPEAGSSLLAFDAGWFCTEPVGANDCDSGFGLLRFVPAP
jgi:hypothetical protein